MKKIWLLLLIVVPFVTAVTDTQQVIMDTNINITIIGYHNPNLNDSFFNISIVTEDETWVKNEIGNQTNSFESYEIDMIRKLNCSETEIYELTQQCKNYFSEYIAYDSLISSLVDLNESKKRCLIDLNESQSKKDYYNEFQSCVGTKKDLNEDLEKLEKDCSDEKNNYYFFIIGAFLLGGGICYWYYFVRGKPKPGKTHFEKERGGAYPTIPSKTSWQEDLNKLGGGNSPK